MAKTNLERQQALRAKREREGLKRFEIWIRPTEWPLMKRYIAILEKRRSKGKP